MYMYILGYNYLTEAQCKVSAGVVGSHVYIVNKEFTQEKLKLLLKSSPINYSVSQCGEKANTSTP